MRLLVDLLRLYRRAVWGRAGSAVRPCCAAVWREVATDVEAALEYLTKHKEDRHG